MGVEDVDVEAVHARVAFDMAIKRAEGNQRFFDTLSFNGVQLTREAEWLKQLCEALSTNETCTALDLSESGLTDAAFQQLAAVLALPTRCKKLRKLNLRGNPQLTQAGETMAQGLCRLRSGLELELGEGLGGGRDGFVHDKSLVEGLSAWPAHELKVSETEQRTLYCPREISGDGERIVLTQGFQGPNGTKYRCDLATFELYHQTGNLVLLKLASSEGVEV